MDLLVAKLYRQAGVLLALFGCLSGCTPGGGNQYQEPPPPTVDVSVPLKHDITDYVEATGTTEPYETVEIRARVEGYLDEIYFEPGQEGIRAGDKLYLIDQKPYQAIVTEARAALTVAEASARDAEAKYERAQIAIAEGGHFARGVV